MRCYRLHRIWTVLRGLPFSLTGPAFELVAGRLWGARVEDSILVIDPFSDSRAVFARVVAEAVDLIRVTDLPRYERLKREITRIINMPVFSVSAYSETTSTCRLDLRCLPLDKDWDSTIILVARLLVHESTHGLLARRRIPYLDSTATRAELLCFREELRFLKKLGLGINETPEQLLRDHKKLSRRDMIKVARESFDHYVTPYQVPKKTADGGEAEDHTL